MLINCPYCGSRDVSEFTYQAEDRERPDPASTDRQAWDDYVYDRLNQAGPHAEIWQHSGGCRSHLRIERNTLTHEVLSVASVRASVAGGRPSSPRGKAGAKP
jgi:methylglutamate dehydrogenase subunit B